MNMIYSYSEVKTPLIAGEKSLVKTKQGMTPFAERKGSIGRKKLSLLLLGSLAGS